MDDCVCNQNSIGDVSKDSFDVGNNYDAKKFYSNSEHNNKLPRGLFNKIMAVLLSISTVCTVGTFCLKSFLFPKRRDFLQDNLFVGKNITISSEEIERIVSSMENELDITIPADLNVAYCVLNSVRENPNLTNEEKDFLYNFVYLINDNPYLDKERGYKSLHNVDIIYMDRPSSYDENVSGVYSFLLEDINIFKDNEDKATLGHEAIHCIYCNEQTTDLPMFFKEGMTELLYNEYFSERPFFELNNYPFEIAVVKMLCELTSPNTVLEAYSTGNMDLIAAGIASGAGTIEDAKYALDRLDYFFRKHNNQLEDDEEANEDDLKTLSYVLPLFRDSISSKYEENAPERVSYFYNEVLFTNLLEDEKAYDAYVDDLVEFGGDFRAYFSSELKKKLADEQTKEILEEAEKKYVKEKNDNE